MDNVKLISEHREIDVTEQQECLLAAEDASLEALARCSQASAAFVAFVKKAGYTMSSPKVRATLTRLREIMDSTASVPLSIYECHNLAHSMAKGSKAGTIVMKGLPKDDDPPPETDL